MSVAVGRLLVDTSVHNRVYQRARAAVSPARRGSGEKSAVRRDYVAITWGELTTALLTMSIITFLLLV
jgi:hypothetical protein